MSKRIPNEERKVSTTIALSLRTLSVLDELGTRSGENRSRIVEKAIMTYYREWIEENDPRIPDDVSEIGYNPYSGCYEEDL